MIFIDEIAELVRAARKTRNMTQLQLAERSKVSLRNIVAFENGHAPNLCFISLARILTATGLELQVVEARSRRPTYEDLLAEQEHERRKGALDS
ncbi:helix-turn-helix domain-containing protein [Devosia submarina]|uniref:helix-turn-helix domain-containing protein n=1 Tax=Devosia submarina TaxID=1173082 RepID=UPI000D3375A4